MLVPQGHFFTDTISCFFLTIQLTQEFGCAKYELLHVFVYFPRLASVSFPDSHIQEHVYEYVLTAEAEVPDALFLFLLPAICLQETASMYQTFPQYAVHNYCAAIHFAPFRSSKLYLCQTK